MNAQTKIKEGTAAALTRAKDDEEQKLDRAVANLAAIKFDEKNLPEPDRIISAHDRELHAHEEKINARMTELNEALEAENKNLHDAARRRDELLSEQTQLTKLRDNITLSRKFMGR